MIFDSVAQPDGQPDDQLYRLYYHEWLVADFLIEGLSLRLGGGPADEAAGWAVYDQHFTDVPRERARVTVFGDTGRRTVTLELLLPCCAGEFRWAFLAARHADELGLADYEIVVKESPRDKELMAASHGLLARTGR